MIATQSRIFLRTATGIGGKTALKALIARAGTSASYASVSQPTGVKAGAAAIAGRTTKVGDLYFHFVMRCEMRRVCVSIKMETS
jgi:hypothetical protein